MADRRHDIRKTIAEVLLCLFAFVYCGNALCIHTHTDAAGHTVTHSHPYLPSSHHSHSSAAFDTINLLNAALQQLTTPASSPYNAFTGVAEGICTELVRALRTSSTHIRQLRAPPCDRPVSAMPLAS